MGVVQQRWFPSVSSTRVAYHCNSFVTELAADEARIAAFATAPGSGGRKVYAQARKHFKSLPRGECAVFRGLDDHLGEDDPAT